MLNALAAHPIKEGTTYRRAASGSLTETVEVLEVANDKMGIPHVRFELRVMCGATGAAVEQRTLALDTFYSRYRERG